MCVKLLFTLEGPPHGQDIVLLKEGTKSWVNETTNPLPTPPNILLNHRSQAQFPLFRAILDPTIPDCVCVHVG